MAGCGGCGGGGGGSCGGGGDGGGGGGGCGGGGGGGGGGCEYPTFLVNYRITSSHSLPLLSLLLIKYNTWRVMLIKPVPSRRRRIDTDRQKTTIQIRQVGKQKSQSLNPGMSLGGGREEEGRSRSVAFPGRYLGSSDFLFFFGEGGGGLKHGRTASSGEG